MTKVRSVNPARIYQARLRAGMTQDDLAHKIRVLSQGEVRTTASRLSRWENGSNSPHAEAVPLIAEATGVTISFLYGSDEPSASDEEEEGSLPTLAHDLYRIVRAIARSGAVA